MSKTDEMANISLLHKVLFDSRRIKVVRFRDIH